jgi:hypothetical protein
VRNSDVHGVSGGLDIDGTERAAREEEKLLAVTAPLGFVASGGGNLPALARSWKGLVINFGVAVFIASIGQPASVRRGLRLIVREWLEAE